MKKSFRKVMSIFLALAIMLCTMSVMASAATYNLVYEKQGEEGDYYAVWITGYKGTLPSKLVIPEKIEGLPVESIEPMAFANNTTIQEVVLPETIYWIEDYAFAKCTNLKKINFPEALGYIDDNAFFNCTKLKTIVYSGYSANQAYMYIGYGNDALSEAEWDWVHYRKDYDSDYREYSLTYKTQTYLEPNYNLKDGDTVLWWTYDDEYDEDSCILVGYDGYVEAFTRGNKSVFYEVIDKNGDVVFFGEDNITVKFNFFQWIINYILFGWAWGF